MINTVFKMGYQNALFEERFLIHLNLGTKLKELFISKFFFKYFLKNKNVHAILVA